jgi:hypothetical protein
MYLRRVGIDESSDAATPTQVSTLVMPPAPAAKKSRREKKGRRGGVAETLPQQVIYNSAAVQQEILSMRLCMGRGKLILAARNFRRVGIDGCCNAAAS